MLNSNVHDIRTIMLHEFAVRLSDDLLLNLVHCKDPTSTLECCSQADLSVNPEQANVPAVSRRRYTWYIWYWSASSKLVTGTLFSLSSSRHQVSGGQAFNMAKAQNMLATSCGLNLQHCHTENEFQMLTADRRLTQRL